MNNIDIYVQNRGRSNDCFAGVRLSRSDHLTIFVGKRDFILSTFGYDTSDSAWSFLKVTPWWAQTTLELVDSGRIHLIRQWALKVLLGEKDASV